MKFLLGFVLALTPAFAQISEIATDATGQTLVFSTRFRLQTESDVAAEQKIYRWQNGVWTRLRVYISNCCLIPGSINNPFVAAGGSVYGWIIYPGRGLFPPVPVHAEAEVAGATLPAGFSRQNLRVSANGRYFVSAPDGPVIAPQTVARQVFDAQTGAVTTLPENTSYPSITSDGTIAYWQQGDIVVQAPGREARRYPVTGVPWTLELSDDARWVAVGSSPDNSQFGQSLSVVSTVDSTVSEIVAADPTTLRRPIWSLGNSGLVYVAKGASGKLTLLKRWDPVTKQSATLEESAEPFAYVTMSANGNVVWAATETNRLVRYDLPGGMRQEILPPLGISAGVAGPAVPGSAMRLAGKFTPEQKVSVNGKVWPLSDVNETGYWFQVPWEWRGTGRTEQTLVRAEGNPFESMASFAFQSLFAPFFPLQQEDLGGFGPSITAAHSDFHGVVTKSDPARGGETIHVYMTGLGALQREVPTGVRGPSDAVRIAREIVCSGQFVGTPVRTDHLPVPAIVYASGMIGIYQLEVTLPPNVPDGVFGLVCWDGERETRGSLATKP